MTPNLGTNDLACSLLPAAMIGDVGLKDGEGEGETKGLSSVIGCEGGKEESEAERPVVGCGKIDETVTGEKVIGCGYSVGNKSNCEDNTEYEDDTFP